MGSPVVAGLPSELSTMEKLRRYKGTSQNKKPATKPKTVKKPENDGPTCSMFLAELTRKLAHKKKKENKTKDIVQSVINSIINVLPVKVSKKSPEKKESPMNIESLEEFAPNNILLMPHTELGIKDEPLLEEEIPRPAFKMPKMPLASSDIIKQAVENKRKLIKEDASVNTVTDHDVAAELTKHVGTLRKISLIAEEFNQKTAKNLKEIVDSVQEDLIKKLEEIEAERKAAERKEKLVQVDDRI